MKALALAAAVLWPMAAFAAPPKNETPIQRCTRVLALKDAPGRHFPDPFLLAAQKECAKQFPNLVTK